MVLEYVDGIRLHDLVFQTHLSACILPKHPFPADYCITQVKYTQESWLSSFALLLHTCMRKEFRMAI
jgi:hypothetical protein